MPFELQTSTDGVRLVMAGRLGAQQARPLWDALQPAMTSGESIRLDAEGVDEMDTSIAQILCRVSDRTRRLQIGAASDNFLLSLRRRGLEKFFVYSLPEPSGPPPPQVAPHRLPAKKRSRAKGLNHG